MASDSISCNLCFGLYHLDEINKILPCVCYGPLVESKIGIGIKLGLLVVGQISTRDAVFLELNKLSSGRSRVGTTEADDKSDLRKTPWTDSGKS
ncbi:hypothetical protein FOPG_12040 [Fusarium oxysporum f. sp. conglutinans race 2 54008]|uniref:Uncharacterized protein n=2 Tax=Fusarium oxysporum TaxID=5507 RepID=X0H828_FUSOX|nr:hypothetical protein FOVG_13991 [Fusarium oxysporum f. sp. pisi HDV247]EXL72387.1 hypothetical protein FOPG_12040 [Fusarium oxysporum f. sp. conglutinans race 2 54008]